MYHIVFSPKALAHFEEAVIDFETKQSGLGLKFYNYTNKRIEVLITHPALPVVFNKVRVLQLRKYKYRLHFTIIESKKEVRVVSIIYARKDPKIWRKFK